MNNISAHWHAKFFDGAVNEYWDSALSGDSVAEVAEFLDDIFPEHCRLLDIPSGSGSIARLLAARGHKVTALDIAKENLDKLNALKLPNISTIRADMTDLPDLGIFEGAYCIGNSFNYLHRGQMPHFLQRVAHSLVNGALFVIHSGAIAESLLLNLEERTWHNAADWTALIEHTYNPLLSVLETDYIFLDSAGSKYKKTMYHYVYTLAETIAMLENASFEIDAVLSGLDGEDYEFGSADCYIIARKKSDAQG